MSIQGMHGSGNDRLNHRTTETAGLSSGSSDTDGECVDRHLPVAVHLRNRHVVLSTNTLPAQTMPALPRFRAVPLKLLRFSIQRQRVG